MENRSVEIQISHKQIRATSASRIQRASVHCEHQSELPALIQEEMENFGEKKEKMENFGEKKEKERSGRSLEERRTTALEQIAASTNSLVSCIQYCFAWMLETKIFQVMWTTFSVMVALTFAITAKKTT